MLEQADMERFAVALQALGVGLLAGVTADVRVKDCVSNPLICELLGFSAAEIADRRTDGLFLLLHPQTRQPLEFSDTTCCRLDGLAVDPDGRERSLQIVRLRAGVSGWAEIFLLRDTSGISEAQICRRRDFKQDILSRLIAGVVHDLNNMLGGIMGSSELLQLKLTGQDLPRRLASTISESSGNAAVLVRNLAQYTHPGQERLEIFDAAEAVRDAADLLRRNLAKQINFQLQLAPGKHKLRGDPLLLRSIVLGLGLEFATGLHGGGTLDLCTGNIWLEPSGNPNPLFPIESGNFFLISFRNTGSALSSEVRLRLLTDPAFSSSRSREAGGFAGIWQAVRDFGGTVRVGDGAEAGGAEVGIYLPSSCSAVGAVAAEQVAQKPLATGGLVLVADDEELMRSALVQMLRSQGYRVIEALDGQEAVGLYRKHADEILFVLLDMVMPKMDGRETFLALKALNPQVRVVIASGYTRDNSFGQLLQDGVGAILRKPFTMRELSDAVGKVLNGVTTGGTTAAGNVAAVGGSCAGEDSGIVENTAASRVRSLSERILAHAAASAKRAGASPVPQVPVQAREEAMAELAENAENGQTAQPLMLNGMPEVLNALLVEDEEVQREVLAGLLESRGYNVVALDNGKEASLLLGRGERFSLCLFDLNLPGATGMALCERAKRAARGEPCYVLIMTGQEPQSAYKSVLSGGADDFLAKPFTLDLMSVRLDVAENSLRNERQRIAAERALRESEERMTLAVENAQLGMGELDFATDKTITSELWHRITGCPKDYPGGSLKYLHDHIHPDDVDKVFRGNDAYRNMEGEVISTEFRIKQPGRGYVWLQAVGRARRHPKVPGACILSGFFQDITARKQMELSQERQRKTLEDMVMERTEELVRINQELRQEMEARALAEQENLRQQKKLMDTEKLASLGTLVSGVGHEINNPTQFIMLNMPFIKGAWTSALPVLDEYYQEHPEFRLRGVPYELARERLPVMAGDILDGAERIEKIVRELKDYARQGMEETFTEVDLRKVADSAQTLLAHFIRQRTDRFSITAPADELRVRANATRIEQVIINLVQNSCLALEGRHKAVRLILKRDLKRRGALIVVEDEGQGIEEKHLRHLTDPFFTTRQSSGGTGLGLSICDRIVHNHRGEMSFSSRPGEGTTMTVFLPEDPEKAGQA